MAGYFENGPRGPVHLLQQGRDGTWHRMDSRGNKVKGNHKASSVTDAPDVLSAKIPYPDQRRQQLAGKLNNMLRNVGSKTASYNYKEEAIKWGNEFKKQGGVWTEKQDAAVKVSLDKNPADRDWFDAFKHNFNLPTIDNGIGHPAGAEDQVQAPEPIAVDPVSPMVARRPEETPRSQDKEAKRRRLNFDEPQVPEPPTSTVAATSSAPVTSAATAVAVPSSTPNPSGGNQRNENMSGAGGAVGVDASGGLPFQTIESHFPVHNVDGGVETFTFGGTRIMYTWAYDFAMGAIPTLNDIGANTCDGAIVGHQLPWEWIPFYCTPAEFAMLPYRHADIYVDKVRVRVTPLAKETQFETASGSTKIASQEHLALGKVCVGLNHKWPNVAQLRAKEQSTPSMNYTTSSLTIVDFKDLRQRFWGNLSDWTAAASPYPGSGIAKPTSQLGIRELENVQVMLWDRWNQTDQGENKFCWGAPLIDRYITRFPLMPAIGKPIIDEEYSPKHGLVYAINTVPLMNVSAKGVKFRGDSNVTNTTFVSYGVKDLQGTASLATDYFKNSNVGTNERSIIGAYHSTIEKNVIVDGHSGLAANNKYHTMPSIMFGMEAIRPIDFASSTVSPVQARCMWKVDYQITFKCVRPEDVYKWPFATHIKPSANIASPTNVQKSYASPVVRLHPLATHAMYPSTTDATETTRPGIEEPIATSKMVHNFYGQPIPNPSGNTSTASEIGGDGYKYVAGPAFNNEAGLAFT